MQFVERRIVGSELDGVEKSGGATATKASLCAREGHVLVVQTHYTSCHRASKSNVRIF